ncbi:uncharacterized protein LOC134269277 [Saccostrea cucullata]|uniref:uncharacterized protein LOC134269277 n=1 Tax=Saccostrea cuccullata TaxID=36930 RepID=UPI002ECFB0C3
MTTTEADPQDSINLIVIIVVIACMVLLISTVSVVICIVLKRRKQTDNNLNTEEDIALNDSDKRGLRNKDENEKYFNIRENHHALTPKTRGNVKISHEDEDTRLISDTDERENYTNINFDISRVWVIVTKDTIQTAKLLQPIIQRYGVSKLAYINNIPGSWKAELNQKDIMIFRSGYFSAGEQITKDFDELFDHLKIHTELCIVFEITKQNWQSLRKDMKLIRSAKVIQISE